MKKGKLVLNDTSWLRPAEEGANSTETCQTSNTITEYVKLTYTYWLITKMQGVDSFKLKAGLYFKIFLINCIYLFIFVLLNVTLH